MVKSDSQWFDSLQRSQLKHPAKQESMVWQNVAQPSLWLYGVSMPFL